MIKFMTINTKFLLATCLTLLCVHLNAQGFAAQIQAAQTPPETPAPQDTAAKQFQTPVPPPSLATPPPPSQPLPPPVIYKPINYEAFLDSIVFFANNILQEKAKTDSLKMLVNAETTAPKDEYEKQADYENRLAAFESEKQQKIKLLEFEYQSKTKSLVDKIKTYITGKEDLQPEWSGMLSKNAETDVYNERLAKFREKISQMKNKIAQVNDFLAKLTFNQSDLEAIAKSWREKNLLYLSRLERACELMQDYIVQEQVKVLSTERKKMQMTLGNYDADKEEFQIDINDSESKTVPIVFSGAIKIAPAQAREINRKTDDFTASIEYMNYPFIVGGVKLYPGAKKAHVYYKNQEIITTGSFKNVQAFEKLGGYIAWAIHVDSLMSGKLAPRNLDSIYAMKANETKLASIPTTPATTTPASSTAAIASETAMPPQIQSGITQEAPQSKGFWTAKNTIRILAFGLSATSVGLAIWQNNEVKNKSETTKNLREQILSETSYNESLAADYNERIKDLNNNKNLRTGFSICAGVFGIAGIATFFF